MDTKTHPETTFTAAQQEFMNEIPGMNQMERAESALGIAFAVMLSPSGQHLSPDQKLDILQAGITFYRVSVIEQMLRVMTADGKVPYGLILPPLDEAKLRKLASSAAMGVVKMSDELPKLAERFHTLCSMLTDRKA